MKKASKTEIKGKRRRNIERESGREGRQREREGVGERGDREREREWERGETERERNNENRVLSNAKRAKKRETFKLRTGPRCAFKCWLI